MILILQKWIFTMSSADTSNEEFYPSTDMTWFNVKTWPQNLSNRRRRVLLSWTISIHIALIWVWSTFSLFAFSGVIWFGRLCSIAHLICVFKHRSVEKLSLTAFVAGVTWASFTTVQTSQCSVAVLLKDCPAKRTILSGGSGQRTFNMDTPNFIHGVLLLLVTAQYPPRNNEVTSHLTRIQPLEVWAVYYALTRKNAQS